MNQLNLPHGTSNLKMKDEMSGHENAGISSFLVSHFQVLHFQSTPFAMSDPGYGELIRLVFHAGSGL